MFLEIDVTLLLHELGDMATRSLVSDELLLMAPMMPRAGRASSNSVLLVDMPDLGHGTSNR